MAEIKFNLSDYTHHILRIAEALQVSNEDAFQYFLANLATMKEHFKGASDLNYHQLGQQWNKLRSSERVSQMTETEARLTKYPQRGKK